MFTWLEIDSGAIKHNLRQFRGIIGKKRLLMPVIKSNAYGHGFLEVAKICGAEREVDRICVVNSDEALALTEKGIKKPIMILSFFELDEKKMEKLVKKNVIFPVYTIQQAKFLDGVGDRMKKKVKIHIKVDTGASRVGILESEIRNFANGIKRLKNLEIEGLFSHFASSEDDAEHTQKQYQAFWRMAEILKQEGVDPPLKHMSCSAASVLFTLKGFNAIRLGLGLYGLYSSEKSRKKISLRPALSLYTKIVQVKNLPVGTKIGYGSTFITSKPTRLAVLPVGYGDGYDRHFSNAASVVIGGRRCPVVGRVCMNLTMVDASAVPQAKVGDTVTLIGKQGKSEITADELAQIAGTINYEIVTRINAILPRQVV